MMVHKDWFGKNHDKKRVWGKSLSGKQIAEKIKRFSPNMFWV